MQIDSKLTIRSIFGKNYSDEMAQNILDIIPSAPKPNNMLDDFVAPVLLSETLDNPAPQSLEVQESSNNNNNNVYSYTHIKNDKTLGKLIDRSLFCQLLMYLCPHRCIQRYV